MTNKEREALDDTLAHIRKVQFYLHEVCRRLMKRAREHDASKLKEPEFSKFAEVDFPSGSQVNDEEYQAALDQLNEALDYHYAYNDHHPEHHASGIEDMHLLQLIELIVDWKAASERHDDGDIFHSIESNQERFGYSDELKRLLRRTAEVLFGDEDSSKRD